MKAILKIGVFVFCAVAVSQQCYASVMVTEVASEKAAKDWGATLRTETVATNQVGVWLEFAPKGKLQSYSSVRLEITSGDRKVVSATLSPSKQTPDKVAVYFLTDPSHLSTSTLTVYYRISGGFPPYDGVCFKVADCIRHDTAR